MSTPVTSSVPTFLQTNHTGNAFTLSFRTTNFSSVNSTWLPTTEISLDRCKTFQYDFHKNIPLSSICAVCFVVGIIVSFVGELLFYCHVLIASTVMHLSIPSANIPPGQPPGFCTYFHPGSPGFVPSGCPGVGPIIKVPSCQLMLHEGTFQLQTDLPSVDAL